jgi:hypothetical protein
MHVEMGNAYILLILYLNPEGKRLLDRPRQDLILK